MKESQFLERHIGPNQSEINKMLACIGTDSLDHLIEEIIPNSIRLNSELILPEPLSEFDYLKKIKLIAEKNKMYRSYIGMGYYNTITPSVILRNVFENPGWYTSYTPYQAEISQGRMEAMLNFQTMVIDLTKLELTNCSLLDEATAAAEAMNMMLALRNKEKTKAGANTFFVDNNIFPQTKDVLNTRSKPLNINIVYGDYDTFEISEDVFGCLVQYPAGDGKVNDYSEFIEKVHAKNALVCVASDLLSLTILKAPGEFGADICIGNSQRLGIPMGYGGPHAGFLSCRDSYKRQIPGRIIGVTKDKNGKPALRLSLQTREQHIKREKATSNICTAQALLASMAGFYAVYHGPDGLRRIARKIHSLTGYLSNELTKLGYQQENDNYFGTLKVILPGHMLKVDIKKLALNKEINFRYIDEKVIAISLDETTRKEDVQDIISIFAQALHKVSPQIATIEDIIYFDEKFVRESTFLEQEVFNRYHSETDMMRYIKMLENKDISLNRSMISLGSCTMKLNAATEMLPVSYPEFTSIHPFVPQDQAAGYHQIIEELEKWLCTITGFDACSLQPNSGSAGEYAGLMIIRQYHLSRNDIQRNIALIPSSAHGTNPASAAMAGMDVIVVDCDNKGNINIEDLRIKAEKYAEKISCLMITYPSTHGVFEAGIKEICEITHQFGGLVYMDGANMNAQVGLTSPGYIGADVCHLNLHKTFAIPHGGGGPGVGPICVNKQLAKFLPSHKVVKTGGSEPISAVSSAPWGSANILVISYAYIQMLGYEGLKKSTEVAILNANYIASCLAKNGFKILYTGESGRVAHEMIVDCHQFKVDADISESDIAKRLMDYGFHAPTLSFPVHGTIMIEPTESESLSELNRFIDALISIKKEIEEIKEGKADKKDNVLKNAPHTAETLCSDEWGSPYSRKQAAYPLAWIKENKYWPPVSRVDDAFGDRNLICNCMPIEEYRNRLA